VLTLAFLPGRATSKAGGAEMVEASLDRRRALLGLLLALLAREAELPEADHELLATLASTVDRRDPQTWSEEQRGRAVAHDLLEPLSILLLASSVSSEAGNANGGASAASGETVPEAGERPAASRLIGS
jgi:hypothetical protein